MRPKANPTTAKALRAGRPGDARDLGASLARKLKRALQDEQNSLLDRLRSLKGTATPANVLPDPEEHPDHFAEAGRPLLQQAAQAGAQVASDLCGDEAVRTGLDAQDVDDLAEELGRSIAEPLRQRLELAMRSAGDDPGSWRTPSVRPTGNGRLSGSRLPPTRRWPPPSPAAHT